jgi:hypothetical protein
MALVRKAGPLDDETGLHLLTLSVLLQDALGPQFIAWDFNALRDELIDRFGSIGPLTWERIMALTILHATNIAWEEWEVFEKTATTINGEIPIFAYIQPLEAEEVAIAIVTMAKVDKHQFSDEVKRYMLSCCLSDGLWYFEGTPLEILQPVLTSFDLSTDTQRAPGPVAAALQAQSGFYDDDEDPAKVQADKVREVQLVLSRYNTAVDEQLRRIPDLLKR